MTHSAAGIPVIRQGTVLFGPVFLVQPTIGTFAVAHDDIRASLSILHFVSHGLVVLGQGKPTRVTLRDSGHGENGMA